jgi:hypothetical protein
MIRALLPALSLFLASPLAVAGPQVSFRDFPVGDVVTVTYSSSGCFSQSHYAFEFQRTATAVTAAIFRLEQQRGAQSDRELEPKRVPLGTVTLSAAEVAGLDRLLAFYRATPGGGCTTIDNITVAQYSGKTLKTSEAFVDASCGAGQVPDATQFSALVAKLAPKAE